ncbi:MAG: hypothetical protein ACLQVD_14615 [Capsulimonadaceae bacterium]
MVGIVANPGKEIGSRCAGRMADGSSLMLVVVVVPEEIDFDEEPRFRAVSGYFDAAGPTAGASLNALIGSLPETPRSVNVLYGPDAILSVDPCRPLSSRINELYTGHGVLTILSQKTAAVNGEVAVEYHAITSHSHVRPFRALGPTFGAALDSAGPLNGYDAATRPPTPCSEADIYRLKLAMQRPEFAGVTPSLA